MDSESPASTSTPRTAESALSFISKGWREVRDSADADIQLMRNRATSFKKLATSFDREFENFFNSASPFSVPPIVLSPSSSSSLTSLSRSSPGDMDFVKRLKPKLTALRRAYSAPDFRNTVLQKWSPRASIQIDLSAIRNAIVAEVGDKNGLVGLDGMDFSQSRKVQSKELKWEWIGEGEERLKNWEPVKALMTRLKEFEYQSSGWEIFGSLKNSEIVEKVKSSLKTICREPQNSKDVPPLDVSELLAYLLRQSGPFLDHLGIGSGVRKKIVQSLLSKRRNLHQSRSLAASDSFFDEDCIHDELDLRIASVLQSTGHCCDSTSTPYDSADSRRHVAIVTTASLPWMTGTAVNPLFRAAYLAKSSQQNVTLLVPWLCRSDQELVYPNNLTFSSPEEQEAYIRHWLEERVGFKADFRISFYPGKFSKERRSIMPAGDTSQFIPAKDADIAILEEPEHLNWYHHGRRWTDKFNHVVGIVHTNYLEYIKREKFGGFQAFLVKHINEWVIRAYCHKVVRLSAATQDLPRSVICNVHGVNPKILKIGEKVAEARQLGQHSFSKGAYFLGKMVWAKGYKELIDILAKHNGDLGGFKLDVFGNGEDAEDVQTTAKRLALNINFHRGRDHADDSLHGYKVFVNPSISDVLCTATAEALAMGKFVVCADHPSNHFFTSFPNCLTYKSPDEFVSKVSEALTRDPQPLTPEQRHHLSWEAATQRFIEHSDLERILNVHEKTNKAGTEKSILTEMIDGGLAFTHYCLTGSEAVRLCSGATPGTRNYDKQHCKDLRLLPSQVVNPIYGW